MKPSVTWDDDSIIISCGECFTKHVLKYHTFGIYHLDNEKFSSIQPTEDDEFRLDGEVLSPMWVCRNFRCNSESRVIVPPPKQNLEAV